MAIALARSVQPVARLKKTDEGGRSHTLTPEPEEEMDIDSRDDRHDDDFDREPSPDPLTFGVDD